MFSLKSYLKKSQWNKWELHFQKWELVWGGWVLQVTKPKQRRKEQPDDTDGRLQSVQSLKLWTVSELPNVVLTHIFVYCIVCSANRTFWSFCPGYNIFHLQNRPAVFCIMLTRLNNPPFLVRSKLLHLSVTYVTNLSFSCPYTFIWLSDLCSEYFH